MRAQCIVHRGNDVLMARHRDRGEVWWCLPGGGVEDGETPEQAAIRELQEECGVSGRIVRETARGPKSITYLVDIGPQEPVVGSDPEFQGYDCGLIGLRWMNLADLPERDRAHLWAGGLLEIAEFFKEVDGWGDSISYPGMDGS